jgi:hypothetical protein
LGEVKETARGFDVIDFVDRNGVACSVQVSSIADFDTPGTSAIFIGANEKAPGSPRAHLTRDQAEGLIVALHTWLKTGRLG